MPDVDREKEEARIALASLVGGLEAACAELFDDKPMTIEQRRDLLGWWRVRKAMIKGAQ